MGIELPAELADVAARTGLSWPEADEDALREQAGAWREAASQLRALSADADISAGGALEAVSGEAGDAARAMWTKFVDPEHGSLTSAAAGAGGAADRLDHAAEQIAEAKVEMVRQLVNAAKNAEAAEAAAEGGHPTALLGVNTLLGGAATNLASVTSSLVEAVGSPGAEPAPGRRVNPDAGAFSERGQGGLLAAVTGLGADVIARADGGSAAIADVLAPAEEAVSPVREKADEVGPAANDGVDVQSRPSVRELPPASPSADVDAPTPPSGITASGPGMSFADAPTPKSGIPVAPGPQPRVPDGTSAAGFTDVAPRPPLHAAAPGMVAPAPGSGMPGPPAVGLQPGVPPPPAPPPLAPQPPAAGAAAPAPPVAPGHRGEQGGRVPPAPQLTPQPVPRSPYAPQQFAPPPPQAIPPAPVQHAAPAPEPAVGTPRRDRQTVVALFRVHMFPIGHLPVASGKPARQLPAPPAETDFAAGLRFPPYDHPESHRIDVDRALDLPPAPPSGVGLAADHPVIEALLAGYDSLAGMHERDWDRRYLVKPDEKAPEYAWPPGERHPEGGCDDGEPVLLDEGELIDRFGSDAGRVFAAAGTPFARRSLPPAHREAGYRRYRVLRRLPMWRAISASWFGQPGGGVRYRAVHSAAELVHLGCLADITDEDSEDRRQAGEEA